MWKKGGGRGRKKGVGNIYCLIDFSWYSYTVYTLNKINTIICISILTTQ